MGYKIYTDGELIGRTGSRNYAILEGTANLAVNAAGSLTFTAASTNPAYSRPKKLSSIISLQRDGDEIFRGRVIDTDTDFYNCCKFICEGTLAFLRDVLKPPFRVVAEANMMPIEYLRRLLEQYNAACDPRRQIQLGVVTVNGTVAVNHSEEWASIFDLASELVSMFGGNMLIRYAGGVAYLDYLDSATGINSEDVQYGKNLLDLQQYTSAAGVFNVIVPTGKDGITIESVNGGNTKLENAESIAEVGRIEIPRSYDTEDPAELKALAEADLDAGIYGADTITVDAALLGRVQLGMLVPVKSNPHRVNTSLLASAIVLDLVDATGDKVTLGAQLRTMTGQSPVSKLDTAQQTGVGVQSVNNVLPDDTGNVQLKPSDIGVVDLIYPIGTIYMSVNSTSPATLFGGTWTRLQNRFLLGAGSSYTNGATGGAATVTLTTDQLPKHNHEGIYYSALAAKNLVTLNSGSVSFHVPWGSSDYAGNYGAGNGSTELMTGNTGGGAAHNNMPPYLVVYMWKRTA